MLGSTGTRPQDAASRLRDRCDNRDCFLCVAGPAIGHERDQEDKYPLEGGTERGDEGHRVEPKGGIMDSDHQQQFCLKWNSFGNNLATSFSNLFKSESLTDVTLFCEGKYPLPSRVEGVRARTHSRPRHRKRISEISPSSSPNSVECKRKSEVGSQSFRD
jgi:hypothetical protein